MQSFYEYGMQMENCFMIPYSMSQLPITESLACVTKSTLIYQQQL